MATSHIRDWWKLGTWYCRNGYLADNGDGFETCVGKWFRLYQIERESVDEGKFSKWLFYKFKHSMFCMFVTPVVLTLFKVIWDANDVSFDIYTFIKLENSTTKM